MAVKSSVDYFLHPSYSFYYYAAAGSADADLTKAVRTFVDPHLHKPMTDPSSCEVIRIIETKRLVHAKGYLNIKADPEQDYTWLRVSKSPVTYFRVKTPNGETHLKRYEGSVFEPIYGLRIGCIGDPSLTVDLADVRVSFDMLMETSGRYEHDYHMFKDLVVNFVHDRSKLLDSFAKRFRDWCFPQEDDNGKN